MLGLTLVAAATANADAPAGEGRGIAIYIDQDMFLPGFNEDRDYTMGVAVEFFQDRSRFYLFDDFARWFGSLTGLQRDPNVYRSFTLAGVAYTPQDLSRSEPIPDDRPYASLIYLSNKRVIVNADKNYAAGLEVLVGVLGLRLTEAFQSWAHEQWRSLADSTDPVDPQGWPNQISDGGEPTVRIRYLDSRLLAASRAQWWDLATSLELNLGFQTNAALGLTARVGKMSPDYWSVPFDPINRGNFMPSTAGNELYLWGAVRARAVGYDALLQGQFRDSPVTVNGDELERLVYEGAVGITKSWTDWQATFAINAKSAEIDLPAAARNHVWGGLYFNFRF